MKSAAITATVLNAAREAPDASLVEPFLGLNEPFSSVSHLLAALLFVALSIALLGRGRGSAGRLACLGVFSFCCVFLLSMSGTYHMLDSEGTARLVLRRLDHAAIFTLIAGTFTAAHGILFRGASRWGVIALLWSLAATGATLKTIFFAEIPEWAGLAVYLGMGWLGLVSGLRLWLAYGFRFVRPLLWGAFAYTFGAVFEFLRAPTPWPGVVGPHELFHVAVLAGMLCHWRFIYAFADGRVPARRVHERRRAPRRERALAGVASVSGAESGHRRPARRS